MHSNAAAALHAAIAQPPHLVGVSAHFVPSDYHDQWVYENGVFNLHFMDIWSANMVNGLARRRDQPDSERLEVDPDDTSRRDRTPLADRTEFKRDGQYYFDFLEQSYYDDFWSSVDFEQHYRDFTVPIQLTGGWFDIFSVGTIRSYRGIHSLGTPRAQNSVQLRMVPAAHGPFISDEWTFPFSSATDAETTSMSAQWWQYVFGDSAHESRPDAVQLYLMAPPVGRTIDRGFWISSPSYPLANTSDTKLYLSSGGNANSLAGDGVLTWEAVPKGDPDHFIHDPVTPMPTHGGSLVPNPGRMPPYEEIPGPRDQTGVEARSDVLVYTSDRLSFRLNIIGPIQCRFWAQTSAASTDFVVKLVVVRPDGSTFNVLDRAITSRLRHGSKGPPNDITPNVPCQYFLELGDTALQLQENMRLRLEIASSNYPRLARNPGTGATVAEEGMLISAEQKIFHDEDHPSYITLPLVQEAALIRGSM
ncbi:hypothetical protein LTR93_010846 [Exophiala xenobiotica]|nr:hypothetical protein LTR93_010846 [Exophiala xenobiotica]